MLFDVQILLQNLSYVPGKLNRYRSINDILQVYKLKFLYKIVYITYIG